AQRPGWSLMMMTHAWSPVGWPVASKSEIWLPMALGISVKSTLWKTAPVAVIPGSVAPLGLMMMLSWLLQAAAARRRASANLDMGDTIAGEQLAIARSFDAV